MSAVQNGGAIRPPVWFRLIAVLALLWNLAGVGAFAMQASMGAETVAALPPAQRDLWFGMPGWAWVAYGLAVAAGTLGAVGLLLRRGWALPAFVVGLATVVVQFTYPFLMTDALSVMGPGMAVLPLAIVVIAVAEVLAARAWRGRGWLH